MCEIKFDRIQVAVIMQTSQTFAIKSKVRLRAPGITILHVFRNKPGNTSIISIIPLSSLRLHIHSKPNFNFLYISVDKRLKETKETQRDSSAEDNVRQVLLFQIRCCTL